MKVADLFALLGLKVDRKSFAVGDRLMSGIKTAVASIAAYKTVDWARGLVQSTADAADHFSKLAASTGIAIEPLQELAYAADLSGVPVEALSSALNIFNRNAGAAARGSKEQARAFKAAGVDAKALAKGSISVEEALGQVADKIASMPDGQKKASLAMDVLGRSGAQLIPFLNEGREGLAALRAEARELGIVFDQETASAFEQFNDDQSRFKASLTGLKYTIVKELLPHLQGAVTRVLAWVKANRKLLIAKITSALKTLGRAVVVLYRALSPLVVGIYKFVEAVVDAADKLGILKYALVAAAIAIGISWAGALLPFVLMAAIIGGIILLAEDLVGAFTGKDSLIKRALQPAIDWLYDTFGGFFSWYEEKMIALGLMKGKDVVSNRMLGDKRSREFQSGKATLVRSSDRSLGEAVRGEAYPVAANARNQAFISARRPQYAKDYLRSAGLSLGINPAFVPAAKGGAPVITTTNQVTVTTTGGDPKAIGDEVDKRMREFAAEQARAMVASVGGTR